MLFWLQKGEVSHLLFCVLLVLVSQIRCFTCLHPSAAQRDNPCSCPGASALQSFHPSPRPPELCFRLSCQSQLDRPVLHSHIHLPIPVRIVLWSAQPTAGQHIGHMGACS